MINPDKITIDRGMQILRRLYELNDEYERLALECGAKVGKIPSWFYFQKTLKEYVKDRLFNERLAAM